MFAKLKDRLTSGASRLNGRTDLLEAVCASAALVAAADGSIDDNEVDATIVAVSSNANLAAAFDSRTIEQTINTMLDRAQAGRAGRSGLYKEIDDVASNPEDAELVLLTAMDIADADGEVDAAETAVINKIANKLRLDPAKYDV